LYSLAFLLLLAAAATPDLSAQDALRYSSRECAICHVRWIDAFERAESEKETMDSVIDRQAGNGDMCLSCHDGSVVDSRFKVWATRHHSTDVIPSASVKIPQETFPLDSQGRMTCATCHTAHAVPDSSDIRTVVFLRQPNVDSSLCLACHPEHAQKNKFQHPLGRADKPVPQNILDAGGKTSEDGHMVFCQTCHEPHGTRNAWMLVLPPAELCISCHTERAPDASPSAGAPVHRIGQTYPGFQPPASLLSRKATFGPNGELDCLSCHRLHDASGAVPLLIRHNQDGSLCLECHDKEKTVIHSPHDLRFSSPETVNTEGQKPMESGVCGTCHRIHGWARAVQDTHMPHSSACVDCHKTGGPGAEGRPYLAAHPVGIPLPADMNPPLPLDEATRDIGCLTCHDPHTPLSAQTSVKEATPAESSDDSSNETAAPTSESHIRPPRSFLRREGSQLCILCHEKIADSLAGPHDPNEFTPEVRQRLGMHTSIGACRVCHTSHNAKGPHLWTQSPLGSDDSGTIDLCGACHNTDLTKQPHVTRHPIAVAPPQPAPEDPNIPPDIKSQSLIGCIGCHNPHGGQGPSEHLRYPADTLCTPCHADKEGIQNSVHDPATSQWAKDLGFVSEGSCFDCHVIHDPNYMNNISRLLPPQDNSEHLCQACHQAGAPGMAVDSLHVGKVVTDLKEALDGLPLGANKDMRCSTCHDIHQKSQSPRLLRAARHDSTLCVVCHGDTSGLLNSPHDLRTSAPDTCNVRGETAAQSGPCGTCHIMHPASDDRNHAATTGDFGASRCLSCHNAANTIAGIPEYADHPDVAMLNRIPPEQPQYMPIFDEHGRPSSSGAISCLTCHNPHTNACNPAATKGATGGLMFIRCQTNQRLCADCHGTEALWRFLYYHKKTRNPRTGQAAAESQERQ
jgi:predicted CXXCH cytochrome family protein